MTEYSDILSTVGYVLQMSSTFQGMMLNWHVTSKIVPEYVHSFLHVVIKSSSKLEVPLPM